MFHWSREEDGRFYTAFICKDLLNSWTVVKAWGGKGKPKSNQMIIACRDYDQALEVMAAITNKRKRRGYKLIEADSLTDVLHHKAANS